MVTIIGARYAAALGAWLTTLVVVVDPAWSEPLSWLAVASIEPGASAGRSELDLVDGPAIPEALEAELPILTTFADREPTDLHLLVGASERWRLMEFGAAMTWRPLAAKLTAFGQLPYAAREELAPAFDDLHEPAALGVIGQARGFEAGAHYRSAGRRLERLIDAPTALKDREGHEVWVAQRLGMLRLRLADSELTDNVDRNPALPRTTKDQSAVTTELALSEWPVLGLTFAAGDSERIRLTPQEWGAEPERREFESVTGSAHYDGGPAWNLTASSTFSRSRHAVRPDDDMAMTSQDLSLTLRLLESLSVTPTLSLAQERYEGSGLGIDTGTTGLTLSYAPPASHWSASSFVSYTASRASDASTDGRSVSVSGALRCALGRWLPGSTVSLEAGYDRYVDAAVPESASRAVSGFVVLRLAAF